VIDAWMPPTYKLAAAIGLAAAAMLLLARIVLPTLLQLLDRKA
jgi:hypothetical protein